MQFSQRTLLNYQFVSIYVSAAQNRYYFPDLPNLRDAYVYYMYSYAKAPMRVDINNTALSTLTAGSYLTLVKGNDEFIKQLDLINLVPWWTTDTQGSVNGGLSISPTQINFSKSYVEITPGLTPSGFPFVFSFGIWYKK